MALWHNGALAHLVAFRGCLEGGGGGGGGEGEVCGQSPHKGFFFGFCLGMLKWGGERSHCFSVALAPSDEHWLQ